LLDTILADTGIQVFLTGITNSPLDLLGRVFGTHRPSHNGAERHGGRALRPRF
jgi:hypothetical protein